MLEWASQIAQCKEPACQCRSHRRRRFDPRVEKLPWRRKWQVTPGMQSQKRQNDLSVCFQGKPFNITVIQVYAPTNNSEEAEVEWFCEELQDLLELTPKKDALFIIGDCNAKVGSQETPGVKRKFGLGAQNEAGQRQTEFC